MAILGGETGNDSHLAITGQRTHRTPVFDFKTIGTGKRGCGELAITGDKDDISLLEAFV
jgi:hypothetical protein